MAGKTGSISSIGCCKFLHDKKFGLREVAGVFAAPDLSRVISLDYHGLSLRQTDDRVAPELDAVVAARAYRAEIY